MANSGLKWFRLAVEFDDNFELVVAEYESKGFEVLIRLFQKIYGNGYYCQWNREVALLFSRKYGVGVNVVEEIVRAAIRRDLFNEEMFKKHSILTSHGIQKWYFDSAGRRTFVEAIKEYLLLTDVEIRENANIIIKNVSRNGENVSRKNTQYITKQNNTCSSENTYYGIYKNVSLASDSYSYIISKIGEEKTQIYIERLSAFLNKNKEVVLDAPSTIIKWALEDKVKEEKKGGTDNRLGINKGMESGNYSSEELNAIFDNLSYEDI